MPTTVAPTAKSPLLKDPNLRLRPMVEEDLHAVVELEALAHAAAPWSLGIFRDCLRAGYSCWVLELAGELVGYGVMSVAVGESHVLNVTVRPRVHGNGLGRHILTRLLNLAKQHRADTAFLEVRISNRRAIGLYESVGFNEIGVRRNYYPSADGREDAIIMALSL